MADPQDRPTLSPDDSARLLEFARACKAAARAVVLYPAAHPAIAATVGRIAQLTSGDQMRHPIRLTIGPDHLLMNEAAPARPDSAIAELAGLLHAHLIGAMVIHPGGDTEAWRQFLLLVGRSPETVRADGGIGRAWAALAGRHIELREIDYAEALRDRTGVESPAWEALIASCLQGDAFELDEAAIDALLAIVGDADRVGELIRAIEARTAAGGMTTKAAALMRMLRTLMETVRERKPEALDAALANVATAVGQLSPDLLLGLLTYLRSAEEGPSVMNAVVSHMS